jgi:hypothetical protein
MADKALLSLFEQWVQQHSTIQYAYPVKGGWERWAQVDFNSYVCWKFVGNTMLEDYCYKNGQKDDLTIGPLQNVSGNFPGALMELKVFNDSETLAAFNAKIQSDKLKLGQDMVPGRAGYRRCSFALAPATPFINLMQKQLNTPGIHNGNFGTYLPQVITSHYTKTVQSASGELFIIMWVFD